MKVTVIGAGNSGMAMAAHLKINGNEVLLWNRSYTTVEKYFESKTIICHGIVNENVTLDYVTNDIEEALNFSDTIMITTPANSHRELALLFAEYIKDEKFIVLNPGRTFGALEFKNILEKNSGKNHTVAETQTIIYTCRRSGADSVNLLKFKSGVLISTINAKENPGIISRLPRCLREYFIPAKSMIETSIGNVGMILHCAPLLLNLGWVENTKTIFKHYYDGITPTIAGFLERLDEERVAVSENLGLKVESTKQWLKRTYKVEGDDLFQCIHNNEAYKTIDAPKTINHRYIFEDVPCGLVPLEAIGKKLGLKMKLTALVIDLANELCGTDYRQSGRNLNNILCNYSVDGFISLMRG
jgi:opine dehydrogenase